MYIYIYTVDAVNIKRLLSFIFRRIDTKFLLILFSIVYLVLSVR